MMLKYRSHALWAVEEQGKESKVIIPAFGWTWIDGVDIVKEVELAEVPIGSVRGSGDSIAYEDVSNFADSHWAGINPHLFNKYSDENCARTPEYQMCYVWRSGKVELLAVGFLAEVYLLNDDGKTIDKIDNPNW